MAHSLAQIRAIARYERLMYWRQRTGFVMMFPLCLITLLLCLSYHNMLTAPHPLVISMPLTVEEQAECAASNMVCSRTQVIDPATASPEMIKQAEMEWQRMLATRLFSMELPLHLFVLILIPLLVADAIPKDSKFRMRELLDTLSMESGTYLAGKVIGAVLMSIESLTIPYMFLGILWWTLISPFDLLPYLALWIGSLVPVAIFSAGLAVLIASGQPSRRRALLVAVVLVVTACLSMAIAFGDVTAFDYLNIGRPIPYRFYIGQLNTLSGSVDEQNVIGQVTNVQVALSAAVGILELVFLWWIARLLLNRRRY